MAQPKLNDEKIRLSLDISEVEHAFLKRAAKQHRVSMKALILRCLEAAGHLPAVPVDSLQLSD